MMPESPSAALRWHSGQSLWLDLGPVADATAARSYFFEQWTHTNVMKASCPVRLWLVIAPAEAALEGEDARGLASLESMALCVDGSCCVCECDARERYVHTESNV